MRQEVKEPKLKRRVFLITHAWSSDKTSSVHSYCRLLMVFDGSTFMNGEREACASFIFLHVSYFNSRKRGISNVIRIDVAVIHFSGFTDNLEPTNACQNMNPLQRRK